jgi:hypothetical protein
MPLDLTLVAVIGRTVASLARDATHLVTTWLALRGTRPEQRPEILRAMIPARTPSSERRRAVLDSPRKKGECSHDTAGS